MADVGKQFRLLPVRGDGAPIDLAGGRVTIGRHPDCTVPIIDEKASRQHCELVAGPGGYLLRDLGSRNGTKLNAEKITEATIRAGDIIKIGSHEFFVEVIAAGVEAPARSAAPATRHEPRVERAVVEEDEAPSNAAFPEPLSLDADEPEDLRDDYETEPSPAEVRGGVRPPPPPSLNDSIQRGSGDGTWMVQIEDLIDALPPKLSAPETVTLIDAGGKHSEALSGPGEGPTMVRLLLRCASKSRATDIHVEPKAEAVHVRMRIDGQMVSIAEMPRKVGDLAFGLIKTACQMAMAARDAVQEGHFAVKFPDRRVDLRISFTPSVHGQKLVIRVLDIRAVPPSLNEIGMAGYMQQRLRRVCDQDHGLLLVCGPTGSGKTTTLYNALREIDRESRNVVTIEDPVEYQLDNVTQIPIDANKGNTFGQLLRSVLRQDPDVILVGEIRDEETARTAMQAAMTGHVVFSSVHAKDTIAAVFRLLDLKVEPYLVANSLDLVMAQRLVRVLCEHCKTPIPVSPGVATRLGRYLGGKTSMYAATGCVRCLRTGYRGRRAIFELLDFTDELRDVVLKEPSISAMKKVIETGMFTTLAQFGWKLVAEGVTTLDEVDRVAGQG
jgi:general secretion pathway protein E